MLLKTNSDHMIDRLRGLAAVFVALGHGMDVAGGAFAASDAYYFLLQPWRPYLGFSWVIAFIVLSGFCIVNSTTKAAARYRILQFIVMRITRIFPMLLICVAFAGAVELLCFGSTFRPAVWNDKFTLEAFGLALIGMAGLNNGSGQFGSIAPSYTITFELFYYLLWGTVVAAMPTMPRRALAICFGLAALLCGWTLTVDSRNSLLLVCFVPWLIGGAAVFARTDWVIRVSPVLLWLILFIFYTFGLQSWAMPRPVGTWTSLIYFAALGVLFAVTVVCQLASESHRSRHDQWLGEISFPLFLVHGPMFILVATGLRWAGWTPTYGVLLAIMFACSLGAAQLLVRFVERPVMAWRSRLRKT